eukprot:MONOS_12322.1-p1 / transcript=MONOS_12322.1 / gene=MONOS_12322 / organism=Monocercomonoides_exilis_PA203 / gene_product=unspecified product / transcript_product=unspecified product / location=Mono_scaffold00675:29415-30056(+) / protein_length=193 / sequence_SO=supercontig / SO=protein_coding / is_pseudo=false
MKNVKSFERHERKIQDVCITNNFNELFCELEHRREDEQKQKIEEMNGLVDEMDEKGFKSVFTIEQLNKIDKMIEEKALSWGNAILLLMHIGYFSALKFFFLFCFDTCSLRDRFEEKIIDENEKKKEEKNEQFLTDLCECFALLIEGSIPKKLLSIVVTRLLKVALKKEENEETQKEVEMPLFALSHIPGYYV